MVQSRYKQMIMEFTGAAHPVMVDNIEEEMRSMHGGTLDHLDRSTFKMAARQANIVLTDPQYLTGLLNAHYDYRLIVDVLDRNSLTAMATMRFSYAPLDYIEAQADKAAARALVLGAVSRGKVVHAGHRYSFEHAPADTEEMLEDPGEPA